MCGIAGIFSLNGNEKKMAFPLHLMGQNMSRRGPDDEGYMLAWFDNHKPLIFRGDNTCDSNNKDIPYYPESHIHSSYEISSHVALSHRRLSILDLSLHGHQPMCTQNQRYWIVYNGEIYNFREIANELKMIGVNFKSQSDTEVLLYAYLEWGHASLHKFNGMFAFAIWDDVKKELFCARDRIGIKPFYYTIQDEMFIFASDIKTIISSRLYLSKINVEGLYHAMSFGVTPRPMTAFKDVFALEQSYWMRIDTNGQIEKQRYWQLPVRTQRSSMSEEEAVSLIQEKLTKAVERRLVADVPVGTFMSGGIDSTTVSAIASQMHPGIKAFTLAFEADTDEFNELDQAKATAAMYQMEHIVLIVRPEVVIEHIHAIIRCYEEPFYSLAPNYIISKLVNDNGIKVVLNGLGGDELFGGYYYYGWLKKWKLLRYMAPATIIFKNMGHRWQRLNDISTAKSADRLHSVLSSRQSEENKRTLFNTTKIKDFNTVEWIHQLYVNSDNKFADEFEAMSYMDMMNNIGNHHVYRVDQFTMNFSVEARLPFLDHELIEAAYQIPSKYKVHGKVRKYILRKVAEKLIHPSCLQMDKKGFSLPMGYWMAGILKDIVDQKLKQLMQRDLFNADEINRRYMEFQLGRHSPQQIWHLVAVELWMESFIDN